MRLLIHGINYAPELTGIGKYTGEMAAWFASQGHDVHVLTAMPYYPKWEKPKNYKWKFWHKEIMANVTVYRCPLYVPKNVTPIKRILHEFSFMLSTLPVWGKRFFAKKYDVVISVSPPFHLGFLPTLYGALRNTPVITHIQDLQVDVARELGMIKNRRFLDILFRAERFVLRKSQAISTISEGMLKKVMAKGFDLSKCLLLPNWVDEDAIKPLAKSESLRKAFGLKNSDRVILYSGNLGEKQGLENILYAAEHFKDFDDVYFVIVGSGGMKQKLTSMAASLQLKNVLFFPLQSYNKLSALLAVGDIHLILQKGSASDLVMPSKLTSILAAGGVPLVTANPGTSIYNVVTENKLGIVVRPDSVEDLRAGIEYSLNADLNRMSANARNYAESYLSKDRILHSWQQQLHEIAGFALAPALSKSAPRRLVHHENRKEVLSNL